MADISVPGRNGYEICEFVKSHPEMEETPVILLVPAFKPFDEERARRIGADYHLTKPFQSIRMLISIVKNLIDREADDEFPVDDDDLTAARESGRGIYTTGELNSRRAKIEELIRQTAQPAPENGVENGAPLKTNPPNGNGRNLDSPPVTSGACEVEIVEDMNMDNILELDDVLPDLTSMSMGSVGSMGPVGQVAAPGLVADRAQTQPPTSSVRNETQSGMVIPQSAIDEIVDRVCAQLSERLIGEIARRIAPEVAELVKRQLFAEPAPYRDLENLLDID
jgi:hypothetical protein